MHAAPLNVKVALALINVVRTNLLSQPPAHGGGEGGEGEEGDGEGHGEFYRLASVLVARFFILINHYA